ncbi:hypothetical protein A3753_27145 [Sulfitobacter sp. HI0082]|nr:hypothetical protein A3753_27145 [Sulfitobacter sp. HI0082]
MRSQWFTAITGRCHNGTPIIHGTSVQNIFILWPMVMIQGFQSFARGQMWSRFLAMIFLVSTGSVGICLTDFKTGLARFMIGLFAQMRMS